MKLNITATIESTLEIDPEDFREAAGDKVAAGEDVTPAIVQELIKEEIVDNPLQDVLNDYELEVNSDSVKIEEVKE